VPPGGPRTKPKALTFALPFARGDLVVVYDAEDRPEPDQLRKAAAAFRERPALGCVQAGLAPDNEDCALAKLFAVEYAANFQVLLPALSAWQVPLPLGGTSNHFPRAVLEKVCGWDPFNVTEDADLGIRLARFGYRTATILSRTYEEAPVTWRQWLPQRRRWVKGWIQTCFVCLGGNIPDTLRLPLRESLAVHGIMTAGVLGLLLYPFSLLLLLATAFALVGGHWPAGLPAKLLLALNCGNILAIMAASFISAYRGLAAAGPRHLAWWIPALPVYWALMSFAAWQALFQFLSEPTRWEKTAHGLARHRRTPPGGALPVRNTAFGGAS
jgi:cellulose synthase/poly-beta-1,6-N-acetylglucosamine synthase-like glycosyltransferase